MDQKIFIYFSLIVSLSNQIYSLPINCHISDDLLALIKQLEDYVRPLAEDEVPIGMEFQVIREFTKHDIYRTSKEESKEQGVKFMINGKDINVDLNDKSPLSRRLELFLTDDRNDNSSLIMLEFTIDRIPISECDGKSHLVPPAAAIKL